MAIIKREDILLLTEQDVYIGTGGDWRFLPLSNTNKKVYKFKVVVLKKRNGEYEVLKNQITGEFIIKDLERILKEPTNIDEKILLLI